MIKSKIILQSILKQLSFVWLAFFLMAFISYLFVKDIVNDYLAKEAKNALYYTQSKIDTDLLGVETSLQNLSQSIRGMILRGNSANAVLEYMTEMSEYLMSNESRTFGFNGVYGFFEAFKNTYLDGTGWIPPKDYVPRERPWYKTAVAAGGNVAATTPYVDAQTGEIVVTYSKRIFDKTGDSLGIVSIDLLLDRVVKYVIETRTTEGGYGILLNENLEVIAIPMKESMGKPFSELPYKGVSNVVNDLKKGIELSEHKITDEKQGADYILFTKRLENGWHIGILTPMDRYYQKVRTMRMFIVVLGVLLALMLSFVLFHIAVAKQKSDEKNRLAETASKAKSEFLAKMSHEIRTPVNAITGMAELALRENLPSTAREHVITIKQAGANLLSIINDILDFSKIESGKLEIIPGNYQFSSLVNDVVSIIRMRVVDSNLSFVVNIDCNVPNSLFGDEIRIRQVLLNILSNAVKYTKKGFVSFSVCAEISDDTALLTIDVADSGFGIKPEDLEKLFGEFVQIDLKSHKGVEGTGLGLAITKRLVNAMGGAISVKSEYGKGSTFTIKLSQKICSPEPLAMVEKPEEKSVLVYEQNKIYAGSIVYTVNNLGVKCESAENDDELREKLKSKDYSFLFVSYALLEKAKAIVDEIGSKTQMVVLTEFGNAVADTSLSVLPMPVYSIFIANILNGISNSFSYSSNENTAIRFIAPNAKILVVDDIDTNLKVASGLMQPYKMHIDLRLSGMDAIEAVKANNYDLVFMDHMMPEMDGIEATKIIRKTHANLPIVALTANAVSGTNEMFLSNGFNDFISKPIDIVKLNSILEKWLPKEKQEKSDASASEAESANFEIEGVDVKKGIAMAGGTLKSYMEILSTFHKDGINKIKEIKQCLEKANYPLYTTYIHALKSVSASIGALNLSEMAKFLEMAGKKADLAYIKLHNPKFLTALETVLNNINAVLLENKKNEPAGPIDFEALKSELNKLKEAIGAFDYNTIYAIANSLKAFAQVAEVENILQKILIGEYDEVVAMIEEFQYPL